MGRTGRKAIIIFTVIYILQFGLISNTVDVSEASATNYDVKCHNRVYSRIRKQLGPSGTCGADSNCYD